MPNEVKNARKVGEELWMMSSNRPAKLRIAMVRTEVYENGDVKTTYRLYQGTNHFADLMEAQLLNNGIWATKTELMHALFDNTN